MQLELPVLNKLLPDRQVNSQLDTWIALESADSIRTLLDTCTKINLQLHEHLGAPSPPDALKQPDSCAACCRALPLGIQGGTQLR